MTIQDQTIDQDEYFKGLSGELSDKGFLVTSVDELINFLRDLNKKTKKRIIITTGLKTPRLLKKCMNKMRDINKMIFTKKL